VTNNVYNKRVPVIQVVPVIEWSARKARIETNVEIHPAPDNGLSKKSVADCLQTRPVDHQFWLGLQMDYELDMAENEIESKIYKEITPLSASG